MFFAKPSRLCGAPNEKKPPVPAGNGRAMNILTGVPAAVRFPAPANLPRMPDPDVRPTR